MLLNRLPRRLLCAACVTGLSFAIAAHAQSASHRERQASLSEPAMLPDVPSRTPDREYPLKAHLLGVHWSGGGTVYHGVGIGNLTEADQTHGFDFSFDCSVPFEANTDPNVFFQSAWHKPGYELDILLARPGVNREDICRLKVVMHRPAIDSSLIYFPPADPGPATAHRWQPPNAPFNQPDPDFPVSLHIITNTSHDIDGGSQGNGTANLLESPPRGLDFSYICSSGFVPNAMPGDAYEGHWIKMDQQLEILTQRMGSTKVDRCTLKVTVHDKPYDNKP